MRALVVWFVLLGVAIANGAIRVAVIIPRTGEYWGHVLSTLSLAALILLVASLSIGWMAPAGARDALLIGVMWVTLTVAFEFLAGHYLFGTPWATLAADYNIARGRIWVLVLAVTLIAPRLAVHWRA